MPLKTAKLEAAPTSALANLSTRFGLPRPIEAFWTTKDGTRLRYAHWRSDDAEKRGSVLFLNGRTEFIEKSIETYGVLVQGGHDLWTLDWRGQGLSGRSLADPHKGHITDYQIYLDDLDQFVREITDLPKGEGKRLMLTHSMGGHLGLRYLHDYPGLIDAAVLLAPMIDITVNRAPVRWINRAIRLLGFGETYALGTGRFKPIFENPADPSDNGTVEDYRALIPSFEGLSRDPRARAEVERYVRDNQALALGGPTAAWLDATFRSIGITKMQGYAEAIETPILMIGGGRDRTVINAEQQRMAARLPHGDFRIIEDGAHELLMECLAIRLEVFAAFSAWTDVEIKALAG